MKKSINQKDMREANFFEVFRIIREHKAVTRKEIQDYASLSWGGTSQIVTRLIENGFIIEGKVEKASAGRPPSCLCINGTNNYIIGIDINKTGIYAEVINLCDDTLYSESCEADLTDYRSMLGSVYSLLDSLLEKFKNYNIFAIGVAMQGPVDAKRGISLHLDFCEGWENIYISDLLFEKYSIPVYVAHDPDCILFAGANSENIGENNILFRIDDGIGMAVMKDGQLISGLGMLEVGHMVVSPDGSRNVNVKNNSLSSYVSKKHIDRIQKNGEDISDYIETMVYLLSEAIANMSILFNADRILICGALMEYKELFFDKLVQETLKKLCLDKSIIFEYDVKKAAYGAALYAIEEHLNCMK